MPDGALLEGLSIGQDSGTVRSLLESLLLESAGPIEVAASRCGRVRGNDGKLGVGMPDGALLEGLSIGQDSGTVRSLLESLLLESAGAIEVAAGAGRGIGGGDGLLRVEVGAGHLLEGLGVGQDAKALGQVLVELLID